MTLWFRTEGLGEELREQYEHCVSVPSHQPEAGFALCKPQCCVRVGSVKHSQPFFLQELPNPETPENPLHPGFLFASSAL